MVTTQLVRILGQWEEKAQEVPGGGGRGVTGLLPTGGVAWLRLDESCQAVFSLAMLSSDHHFDHEVSQRCHLVPGRGHC